MTLKGHRSKTSITHAPPANTPSPRSRKSGNRSSVTFCNLAPSPLAWVRLFNRTPTAPQPNNRTHKLQKIETTVTRLGISGTGEPAKPRHPRNSAQRAVLSRGKKSRNRSICHLLHPSQPITWVHRTPTEHTNCKKSAELPRRLAPSGTGQPAKPRHPSTTLHNTPSPG
jgi:hypothetical protein